jgi:hypothetical protein
MHHARRIASRGATLLHWTACLGPIICMGNSLAKKYVDDNPDLYNKYPYAQQYCSDVLQKVGLPDVKTAPSNIDHAGFNTIFIEENRLQNIELLHLASQSNKQLEDKLEQDKKTLKGILYHEANHILHGDITWRFLAAAVAAPLITHTGIKGLRTLMKLTQPSSGRFANTKKILSGFGKGTISSQLFYYASRQIEQQADDAISDQESIKGCIQFLNKANEHNKKTFTDLKNNSDIVKLNEICPLYLKYIEMIEDTPLLLDPLHPPIKKRIEKLESRLVEK